MLSVLAELQRELIVANANDGLASARARGRVGGRRPKLTADQASLAQRLYDEREKTVQQIADMSGVPRSTVYGHLDKTDKADQQGTGGDRQCHTAHAGDTPPAGEIPLPLLDCAPDATEICPLTRGCLPLVGTELLVRTAHSARCVIIGTAGHALPFLSTHSQRANASGRRMLLLSSSIRTTVAPKGSEWLSWIGVKANSTAALSPSNQRTLARSQPHRRILAAPRTERQHLCPVSAKPAPGLNKPGPIRSPFRRTIRGGMAAIRSRGTLPLSHRTSSDSHGRGKAG
ncbi:helix-turn-helix domain-containing protein [Streptomyces inhibens]|uniref:helix-turn-helix domain-containing protein n=1 Tax=Streptomyces inhibens TaxID=2293571 RepID=UPI003CC825DF